MADPRRTVLWALFAAILAVVILFGLRRAPATTPADAGATAPAAGPDIADPPPAPAARPARTTPASAPGQQHPPAAPITAVAAVNAQQAAPAADVHPPPPAAVPLAGSAPVPATGKPTGPFSLSWRFVRRNDGAEGVVTVTNHGSAPALRLELAAVGSTRLLSPATREVQVPQDAAHELPVAVQLGTGRNALAVTATQLAPGGRARTVLIAFDAPPAAVVVPEAPPTANGALQGTHTLNDGEGRRIRFHPSQQ